MSNVFFIDALNSDDDILCNKLNELIMSKDFFSFIQKGDKVAIKSHFGESPNMGFVRPQYVKTLGKIVKSLGAYPFMTETSTLYKGNRSNAINHISLANEHGFGYENIEMPILIADGLNGEDGLDIEIEGNIFKKINVASLIVKCNALIVVSHITGHMLAGFGGAIKNMAMGCVSRKAKLLQHSKEKPKILNESCSGCKKCVEWCPSNAIVENDNRVSIIKKKCIGCGQCLTICKSNAIDINWDSSNDDFQKKIAENALGVYKSQKDRIIFINFITRVSKSCDCMKSFKQIVPDIGILISTDPVALDKASIDLIEQHSGKNFSDIAYRVPYRTQFEYGKEIGLGSTEYQLLKIS